MKEGLLSDVNESAVLISLLPFFYLSIGINERLVGLDLS